MKPEMIVISKQNANETRIKTRLKTMFFIAFGNALNKKWKKTVITEILNFKLSQTINKDYDFE